MNNIFNKIILSIYFSLGLIVLLNCGDDKVIFGSGGLQDTLPINSLEFVPKRKYVSMADTNIKVKFGQYRLGFECAVIKELGTFTLNDTVFFPRILAQMPSTIDECALSTSAKDTTKSIFFELDISKDFNRVYLVNDYIWIDTLDSDSSNLSYAKYGDTTDQAILISLSHKKLYADSLWAQADTSKVMGTSPIQWLQDSLKIPCADSLSYATYCLSYTRDSLFSKVSTVTGWDADSSCTDWYLMNQDDSIFITGTVADSAQGCDSILQYF